ncbi:hypothetical protein V6N11_001238 [Hibiscus sabdariffa]|uniref:Uncharacterized protein n=1 Tax=Hibiscus sabdariffa TaxID=183260 RepID=A0ABR2RZI2_9ROSI
MCFEHLCHERPFMLLIENEVPPINTLAMNPETELVRAEEEPETEVVFVSLKGARRSEALKVPVAEVRGARRRH